MEDIDKKIKNMELIIAMRMLQEEDTMENRNRMINEMMKSKFVTPATIDPKDEERVRSNKNKDARTSVQVSFKIVKSPDGRKFLPAFTDTVQYDAWKERSGIKDGLRNMIMNFDVYAQYILNSNGDLDGFIINPYGENIVFTTNLIKSIIMRKAQHLSQENEKKIQAARAKEGSKEE